MSDKHNWKQIVGGLGVLLVCTGIVGFMGFAVGSLIRGPFAEDMGDVGEICYPNDTCSQGLTCFDIRGDKVCETAIKPVHLKDEKFCYSFKDDAGEQTPCFKTQHDCQSSFGRMLETKATPIKGCSYEGNFTKGPDEL